MDRGRRLEAEQRSLRLGLGQGPRTLFWPEEIVDRAAAARLAMAGPLDVLVTHEAPEGPWVHEIGPFRNGDRAYERDARIDREIIAGVREAIRPRLHVFGHWHRRCSIDTAPGRTKRHPLEVLGRDGDQEGALIIWDSETRIVEDVEVHAAERPLFKDGLDEQRLGRLL